MECLLRHSPTILLRLLVDRLSTSADPKIALNVSPIKLEANERHVMARNCAPQVAEYQAQRKARRDLRRRGIIEDGPMDLNKRQTTSTSSALTPHYSTIQNTCVTAPEVTEGPYYLRNDLVRTDLRESQAGTPLYLDIGVLDITTCTPATNVFVEIWACNAQGVYSGFSSASTGGGGGGPGGGGGGSSKTDANNFLRGGYQTNANGVVELLTIYPGFYTGRTIHIHTMIHQNIQTNANGTFTSSSGSLRHIGQIFFDETLNTEVLAQTAYAANGRSHTLNSQDSILAQENSGGNSAYAKVTKLGSTLSSGLLYVYPFSLNVTLTSSFSNSPFSVGISVSESCHLRFNFLIESI
ncbi:hypothetical protein M408DRAFT_322976 [Serendipita vermifera MAFF 305830]|uniref:Intradiol ring-cleavage dioxygenases domain-containing protein n=1 Tax=Serendipita vermifera MAFF 305830 TaxID=933852 RepID=A0A0C3AQX9_SERVB|nr:hypothetical protein M408DRAFT_322976 [Serendipita vermifera MAFF 305830]